MKRRESMVLDDFGLHTEVSVGCQLRTIATIENCVKSACQNGLRPVVEIDLDLCALRPVFRTVKALIQVGKDFAIHEFLEASSSGLLPGYSNEAWDAFLSFTNLDLKFPHE